MPGKECNGVATDQPYEKQGNSYCRGFYDRALSNSPTNPFVQAEDPVGFADYARGVTDCAAFAGSTLTADDTACCAGAGLTVPV